jgi:hypothetical protein
MSRGELRVVPNRFVMENAIAQHPNLVNALLHIAALHAMRHCRNARRSN